MEIFILFGQSEKVMAEEAEPGSQEPPNLPDQKQSPVRCMRGFHCHSLSGLNIGIFMISG